MHFPVAEVVVNQLAMMGLLPSPAVQAHDSWHTIWPLLLLVVVLCAAFPLAYVFGRNRGRPGA